MSEYLLILLAAAAVTYILTPLVRRFAVAVGAMHAARERDVHEQPTPLLGGFAIYGGLVAALLLASRLSGLSSVFAETNMEKGLLLAGGLVVVMGFVDDRWGMGALSKLAGQVAAGVILVWSGAEITWLPAPGGVTFLLTNDQQIAVTILVVVVTMNAVNFIDGLDGLAAGIVGIGAIAFFAYYYTLTHRLGLVEQAGPALVSILLAGVCIGFLPHNFYPARIFMGDTGSLLIGLLLAYAPISSLALLDPYSLTDTAAYAAGTVNRYGAFIPLLVPAVILLIPYADLLMAVVRRTRAGTSVFAPDKKHLQHRLLAIGHSHRTSVLIMYLWTALFAGTVIWLSIVRTPLIVLAIVTVAAILALLLVTMPRLRPWSRITAADGTAHSARRAAPVPVPAEAAGERAAVTSPPERTAWQRDGRTSLGGNGAPSSGARAGGAPRGDARAGAPRSGTAGNSAAGTSAAGNRAPGNRAPGNRGAGKGSGGNAASRGDPADRGATGSDGTSNGAGPGRADPVTGVPDAGVPGARVPGAGTPGAGPTSGPGIPAAATSGGALPGDPPGQPVTRSSTRGGPPREASRVAPPWEGSRGGPPWDTVRGGPPWEPSRGGPPWETVRGDPPWDTVRGIRGGSPWEPPHDGLPWGTIRDDEPPSGPGTDPGDPPWPSEPPRRP